MYIYDQGQTSSVAVGIGQLDVFGKSQKKTAQESAEATRLENEMTKLADKAAWSGVDRTYENWKKVRDENDNTKWPIYQLAAHAAMMLGKAASRYFRLWTALALLKLAQGPSEQHDKMNKEIKILGDKWALVDIRLTRKSDASLVPVPSIDARLGGSEAINLAQEKLRTDRKFAGLLPLGGYTIGGQPILLKEDMAWSRVWVTRFFQKQDGSFKLQYVPRKSTSEVNPPLHQYD
jgi:hypothetical protein